jgi:hypothetical protein
MTPVEYAVFVLSGGLVGTVVVTALSFYLVADQLWRRAVWEDDATVCGKAKTTAGYVRRNAKWGELPNIVARGFAAGATLLGVAVPFGIGLWRIFAM